MHFALNVLSFDATLTELSCWGITGRRSVDAFSSVLLASFFRAVSYRHYEGPNRFKVSSIIINYTCIWLTMLCSMDNQGRPKLVSNGLLPTKSLTWWTFSERLWNRGPDLNCFCLFLLLFSLSFPAMELATLWQIGLGKDENQGSLWVELDLLPADLQTFA